MNTQRELLQFKRLILDKEVLLLNMQMDMSRYGEFRMDYNSLITDLDRTIEQQYALLCKHENNQTESKQHEESQDGQGAGSPHA